MTANYPTDEVAATPEYVFELLRDLLARQSPWPVPASAVSFEDVADEPAAQHCGPLTDLDWLLFDVLGLHIPPHEAAHALETYSQRTVREVCAFIARHITRPVIRPWKHIAGECLPAGAFLTVRAMLANWGANPNRITPSTSLFRYLRRYGEWLLPALARLAPGRLPTLTERFPLWGFLSILVAPMPMFLVLLLAEWGIRAPAWVFVATVFGGAPFTVLGIALMIREVLRPRLGELQTFRDLAYCLARQEPQQPIEPTE
ncbi:MAG: hypothetical protein L0241_12600 [Planctomycetia bacterium]|nr:hypothetical protein [Planctomycetia bacterium]